MYISIQQNNFTTCLHQHKVASVYVPTRICNGLICITSGPCALLHLQNIISFITSTIFNSIHCIINSSIYYILFYMYVDDIFYYYNCSVTYACISNTIHQTYFAQTDHFNSGLHVSAFLI